MTTPLLLRIQPRASGATADAFQLDLRRGELSRGGETSQIRPKPLAVLAYLIEHRDRPVLGDELLDAVWADVAVSQTALSSAIKLLRRALGDDAEAPGFIETRRGLGYRFVGSVVATDVGVADRGFVGRKDLLAQMSHPLEHGTTPGGHVTFFRGEAGIGKSRLLRELETRAQESGWATAAVGCPEEGGAPPYWPWTRLLAALHDQGLVSADPLADWSATVTSSEAGIELVATPSGTPAATQRYLKLLRALRDATTTGSLWLAIDDLHAADPSSLDLLRYLARDIETLPLRLVLGVRRPAGTSDAIHRVEAALARLPQCDLIDLARLEEPELLQIVDSVRNDLSDEVRQAIAGQAAGNPFYARELARAGGGLEGPLPPAVLEATRGRIASLPDDSRVALAQAAVLGRRFAADHLAGALGWSPERTTRALADAMSDGLIVEIGENSWFEHEIVRESVLATLSHSERARLHLRGGEALEGSADADVHPEILAMLFQHGSKEGRARAAEYSRRAALRALVELAPRNAIGHFERALEALDLEADDRPALRGELLTGLGFARASSDASLAEVEEALTPAVEIAAGRADGTALGLALLSYHGMTPKRVDFASRLDEAMALRGPRNDIVAVGLLVLHSLVQLHRSDRAGARAAATEACEIAEKIDRPLPRSAAQTAHLSTLATGQPLPLLEAANRAVHSARAANAPLLEVEAHSKRLRALLELGDADAFVAHEESGRLSEAAGLEVARLLFHQQGAALAVNGGDLDRADAQISAGLKNVDGDALRGHFLGFMAGLVARERGQFEWVAENYAVLHAAAPSPFSASGLADGRALLGDLESSAALIRSIDAEAIDRGPLVSRRFVAARLARASVAIGDPALAERFDGWLAPDLDLHIVGGGLLCLGPAARYAGILREFLGRHEEAETCFLRAIHSSSVAGSALWEARARCDLAALRLRMGGRVEQTRTELDQTVAWSQGRGLGLLEARLAATNEIGKVVPLRTERRVRR